MSHYGYVSEQLLNGGVFPPRRDRGQRRWRLGRRERGVTQPGPPEPVLEVSTPRRRKVGALAQVVHGRR